MDYGKDTNSMFTIAHAKLLPTQESEQQLLNLISIFNEIRAYCLTLTREIYNTKLGKNEIPLAKIGKNKGKSIQYDSWVESEAKKKFKEAYGNDIVHNAYRDCRKVTSRKLKEDQVIKKSQKSDKKRTKKSKSKFNTNYQTNQFYFERSENKNSFCKIGDNKLAINEHSIDIQWQKPPTTLENGFGIRIIGRTAKSKSKYHDKWHMLIDYDNGLERIPVDYKNGCIGIDSNQSTIDAVLINNKGEFVKQKIFPLASVRRKISLKDVSYDKKKNLLIMSIKRVVRWAKKHNCPVILELLADGSGNGGGHFVHFPKAIYQEKFLRELIKQQVPFKFVSSRYTSRVGLHKFGKEMREPSAAAFTIARRGLFLGNNYVDGLEIKTMRNNKVDKEEIDEIIQNNKKLEHEVVYIHEKPKIENFSEDQTLAIATSILDKIPVDKRSKDQYNVYRVLYDAKKGKKALTKVCKEAIKLIDPSMSIKEIKEILKQ